MTLDSFVTKYNGTYIDYDGYYGPQCVDLIAFYTLEVQGVTLPPHPSAKDYWTYGIPGYTKISSPQKGDIVVYDGHGIYTDGHISIYYDGREFEQNADPDGSPCHLYARSHTYLLGYLRKGADVGRVLNATNIIHIWQDKLPGQRPPDSYIKFWTGKDALDMLYDLRHNVPEWANAGKVPLNKTTVLDYVNKKLT